jgi:hypothetical protein
VYVGGELDGESTHGGDSAHLARSIDPDTRPSSDDRPCRELRKVAPMVANTLVGRERCPRDAAAHGKGQ